MQQTILKELKQLKSAIAVLIGTSDLPDAEQFSKEAISKAAREFRKMHADRSEWIKESEIGRYLKNSSWSAGKFIRSEFGFNAWIKDGHYYLYHRKALQQLSAELKERNVHLGRYIEYKRSEAEYRKKISVNKAVNKGKRTFQLPKDLKDITTTPIPEPSVEKIQEDLKQLKDVFFENKMGDYIDIYKDNHAMLKSMYYFEKYIDPAIKRRCKKWCDDFNYANHAMELITKKKETFVPVKEEDMIQL
ncbi:MAG: hypothetical protein QM768_12415 [Agriterribacter sp.]